MRNQSIWVRKSIGFGDRIKAGNQLYNIRVFYRDYPEYDSYRESDALDPAITDNLRYRFDKGSTLTFLTDRSEMARMIHRTIPAHYGRLAESTGASFLINIRNVTSRYDYWMTIYSYAVRWHRVPTVTCFSD